MFFRSYSLRARQHLRQINDLIQKRERMNYIVASHEGESSLDFYSCVDEGKVEIASVIQDLLNDNQLDTQEKLLLASQQYKFDGKFCCFVDNKNTNDELIVSFLDEVLKSDEPLIKETINILKNREFVDRLTRDDLVFRYIDILKKLPIHVSLLILNHHVIDKLSHYAGTNPTEYDETMKELIEALSFKSEKPSQRYKIDMMRLKQTPSPSAPELLPEAAMTLNNELPLATAVLTAINVQRELGYGRPDLPEYLSAYINESIQYYSHPRLLFSQDFTLMAGIKLIFSWLFCRQETLSKSMFLTNLMNDINQNQNKSYSDCVDDAIVRLPHNNQPWLEDSRIARILDKLYSLDIPVAMVQADISNAEADIYKKSDINQAPMVTLAPRQGF